MVVMMDGPTKHPLERAGRGQQRQYGRDHNLRRGDARGALTFTSESDRVRPRAALTPVISGPMPQR
jgi:hypothetical protein